MKRIGLVLLVLLLSVVILIGCSAPTGEKEDVNKEADNIVLTLEELKEYNGKDGKAAYIAVDDIIYDVSEIDPWAGGEHNGFEAGNDLTDEIKNKSPHGISKLEGVPKVGKLSK